MAYGLKTSSCDPLTWFKNLSDYCNFWKMKDGSLMIHTLASFNYFTWRNLFQNCANDMSEMVKMLNKCLSKNPKFCVASADFVQISS